MPDDGTAAGDVVQEAFFWTGMLDRIDTAGGKLQSFVADSSAQSGHRRRVSSSSEGGFIPSVAARAPLVASAPLLAAGLYLTVGAVTTFLFDRPVRYEVAIA